MNTKIINVVKSFNSTNPFWRDNVESNKKLVDAVLNYCYEKFRVRGYLFLNEVYRELGFPATMEGQMAGWIYSKEHAEDYMWTVWIKDSESCEIGITFEPLMNILGMLPYEEGTL